MTFATPIRDAIALLSTERDRWRADAMRPSGIVTDEIVEARYGCVPVEAFPFLDTGADGCHYALWIDDAAQDWAPCVVFVCPMDPTPERIRLVAANATDAITLFQRAGYWFQDDEQAVRALEARAVDARAPRIVHATDDGLGVVCAEPSAIRPDHATLQAWSDDADTLRARMSTLSPGLALAAARDLIARHDAAGLEPFADLCAAIYRALGRPLHAEIAAKTYGRDPAMKRLIAELIE